MTVSVAPHISGGPAQRVQELLSHPGDDFPILRQSCQGIIDCTEDDTSSANDVSEVITHDQALPTTRQGMEVGLGTHIDFSTTCAWRTTNCHFQGVNERVLPLLSSNEFFDHTGTVCQFLWSRNVVSNTTGPLSQEREPAVLLTHTPSVLHIFFFDPMAAKPCFLFFYTGSIAGEWTLSILFLLAIITILFFFSFKLFFLSVEPPEL